MAFPADFLDRLRAQCGLTDIVARHVPLRRGGREPVGLCPFHDEKTPSFTVSEDKGFFHCFGCGAHGDAIGFVMRIEGLSFPEAVERLAREAGLEPPRSSSAEREAARREADLHAVMEACCRYFERELAGPRGGAARAYLAERGIDAGTAARFRLGFAPNARTALRGAVMSPAVTETTLVEAGMLIRPDEGAPYDRFRGRVIFPIGDRRGRVVAFGGRTLGAGGPKYLNSPDTPLFNKGRVLYGMAAARRAARETGRILVAEGYTDVIALAGAGIAEAVAPLGTALTESHLATLWRMADEPILCFDGDEAGRRAAWRAAERALPLLRPGKSLQFVRLPTGEDPDSLIAEGGRAAFERLLTGTESLIGIVWEMCTAGMRFDTPERVAGLEQSLNRLTDRIDDRNIRFMYRGALRNRVRETHGVPARRRPAALSPGTAPERLREHGPRAVVATLLGHPGLADEFSKPLAGLTLPDRRLDKLFKEILILAAGNPELDASALRHQLTGVDAREADTLLRGGTYAQWPFARPDSPRDAARARLGQILRRISGSALNADIAAAERALADDPSEENTDQLLRLMAIRQDGEAAEAAAIDAVDEDGGYA